MCPRAGLFSPTALEGLKVSSQPFPEPLLQLWRQAGVGSVMGSQTWPWEVSPGRTIPKDILPRGPEVHLDSPVSVVSPQVRVLLATVNKAMCLHSWGWVARGPLSLLLWVRRGRSCESVGVAKINTLLLCPINLTSVRGWLYPPVLPFNGFRWQ